MDRKLTPAEILEKLARGAMEHIANTAGSNMPATGKCRPYGCRFDIPDSRNEGFLAVECCASDENLRTVKTMVKRSGSPYATMHFHFTGTMRETMDYLADSTHADTLIKSIMELSASVDDHADEYPMG